MISPVVFSAQLQQSFTLFGLAGSMAPALSTALGNGIINSILATNIYNGATVGTAGPIGNGTGKIIGLVPNLCGLNITTGLLMSGIVGAQAANLGNAIGFAFANHITALGIVTSVGSPVAIGTGTGVITGIVSTVMAQSILASCASSGLTGSMISGLANGVSVGIALSMAATVVQTVIVGVPFPPPLAVPAISVEVGKLT